MAVTLSSVVASIPSPPSNSIEIGPLELRAYGFLIAMGVLAGVWLAGRRLGDRGIDPELATKIAFAAVPAGLVGARAYYVLTNWDRFSDDLGSAFAIWEGGLGIPGGLVTGVAAALWVIRREGAPMAEVFDAAAPALPLAQAIGRFGNWFNQELYGRPTDLPWALEIDEGQRLDGYESFETFHPTFAYEILWNLGLLGFLLWLDRRRVLRPGRLFAVYLLGYAIGRFWIETIRIDPVAELFDIRFHIWAMGAVIVAAAGYLIWSARTRPTEDSDAGDTAADGTGIDDDDGVTVAVAAGADDADDADGDDDPGERGDDGSGVTPRS